MGTNDIVKCDLEKVKQDCRDLEVEVKETGSRIFLLSFAREGCRQKWTYHLGQHLPVWLVSLTVFELP